MRTDDVKPSEQTPGRIAADAARARKRRRNQIRFGSSLRGLNSVAARACGFEMRSVELAPGSPASQRYMALKQHQVGLH